MVEKILKEIRSKIEDEYKKRTPQSFKLFEQAQKYLPGGDTRSVVFFKPHPLYFTKGEGAYLTDVDGNVYLDMINNFSALIHGHSYPPITEAVTQKIKQGTVWAGYSEEQIRLAETLCQRVKSIDKVRFVNSGTEATMGAVLAARAFTGKNKIVKMEGGYHGSADLFRISVHPNISKAGSVDHPTGNAEPGVSEGVASEVIIVPFNNIEATKFIIEKYKGDIAAVITEPQLGAAGQVPATYEYLHFLRDISDKLGILLILDEVQTLRLAYGGFQETYDIMPDLTTMGKIIGGGFAVGAIGGREDIMDVFSPLAIKSTSHSGTFNGNPVTMTAGHVAMQYYDQSAVAYVNQLGDSLREGIRKVFDDVKIKSQITGYGSLLQIHFLPEPVFDYRSSGVGHTEPGTPYANIVHLMFLGLINRGVLCAKRDMFCISTVMKPVEIDGVIAAFKDALLDILPYIKAVPPDLL